MTDYNALKVPDLKTMLGQRKLLQTGNKQALIARLQEDDEKNAPVSTDEKPDAKEITYSDDEALVSEPAVEEHALAVTESKPEEASASEEAAVPAGGDGSAAETTEPAAPAPSFAMGLPSTAAEEEAKKRAERAKRFGLDQKEIASGLDSALPERPLKRGRGRGIEGDGTRPGKRQSLDRRGRHGRGPRTGGNSNESNKERGSSTLDDASERAKAEKRAARFATS